MSIIYAFLFSKYKFYQKWFPSSPPCLTTVDSLTKTSKRSGHWSLDNHIVTLSAPYYTQFLSWSNKSSLYIWLHFCGFPMCPSISHLMFISKIYHWRTVYISLKSSPTMIEVRPIYPRTFSSVVPLSWYYGNSTWLTSFISLPRLYCLW